MSFNRGKAKVKSTAKKGNPWSKDVIVDPRGQWAHPGQVTKVPSGNITMRGVNYPVFGVDEYGNEQMMMPGGEYQFPGNMVTEYPMMQMGGIPAGAGPLKEQNPYLIPEYNQPMANGYILPDINRPQLEGSNATEYKRSYDTGTPNEIQIPSIVNGQYLGDRALDRFRATGERFKTMADPSAYSQYYDYVNELGLMQQQYGGQSTDVVMPGYAYDPNPVFNQRHPSGVPMPTPNETYKAKGKLKKTVKQPLINKAYDIASNPLTALANSRNGVPDYMGNAIQTGNLDRNALEMASDVVNPIAYANLVGDVYGDVSQGNYGSAAFNAATMIPGIGTAGKYANQYRNFRRGLPGRVNNPLGPLTTGMSRKSSSNHFDFGRGNIVEDFDINGNRQALYDRFGKKLFGTPKVNMLGEEMSDEAASLADRFRKDFKASVTDKIDNTPGFKNQSYEDIMTEAHQLNAKEILDEVNISKNISKKQGSRDSYKYDESLSEDLAEAKMLGKDTEAIIKEATGMSKKQYNAFVNKSDKAIWDEVVGKNYNPTMPVDFRGQPVFELQSKIIPNSSFTGDEALRIIKRKNPFRKLDYSKELPINDESLWRALTFRHGDTPSQGLSKMMYNDAVRRRASEMQGNEKLMNQIKSAGKTQEGLPELLNPMFWLRENQYGGEMAFNGRGAHQPFMEGSSMPSLRNIKDSLNKIDNVKKNKTEIKTQDVITGYDQQWDGKKWTQTPRYESIPYRSVIKKDNAMNVPKGYHVMPDGSLMLNSEMNCGGGIPRMHRQFGGSSQAPQNTTIDTIGQTRTDLMKNYLAANTYGAMLDQEAQRLQDEMQNYFQNGGSVYNPNLYGAQQYADTIDASRNQFKKDWKQFGNAFNQVSANAQKRPQPGQPGQQPAGNPAMDGMPNQGFGSAQPDTFGRNTDQSFGQGNPMQLGDAFNEPVGGFNPDLYKQYGGAQLPMAQYGKTGNFSINPNTIPQQGQSPFQFHIPGVTDRPSQLMIEAGASGTTRWNDVEAAREAGAARYPAGTIPMTSDPSGGVGRSMATSGFVPTGAVATDDPTLAKGTRTDINGAKAYLELTKDELKGVNSEKEYWDAVSAKAKKAKGKSVSAATKKKANQSTVGKTPAVVKEIEQARKDEARGNYFEDTPSVAGRTRTNYTPDTPYGNQAVFPQYGGGRLKIKGKFTDPVTGDKIRKIKYDTAQGPRDYYGGRGPRVVKYDIYNNPIFQQQGLPGGSNSPALETPTVDESGNVVNNAPGYTPSIPDWIRNPLGEYASYPNAGSGVLRNTQIPMLPPGVSQRDIYESGYQTASDYLNGNQPPVNVEGLMVNPNLPPTQGGFPAGTPSRGIPGETTSPDLERRFQRNVVNDFERGIFDKQYGGEGAYFFQDGGGFNFGDTDPNDPMYNQFGFDESNTSSANTGEDAYAMTDPGDPTAKAKWKNKGTGQGLNQWAPMIMPAMDMISSIAEQGDARRNEAQLQSLKQASNVFTPNSNISRGKHTVNQGYFDPSNMVATQFAGNDQGYIGSPNTYAQMGGTAFQQYLQQYPEATPADTLGGGADMRGRKFSFTGFTPQQEALKNAYTQTYGMQAVPSTDPNLVDPRFLQENIWDERDARIPQKNYGGQPQYQDGGEYYLSEEEIQQVMAMGGQIEYL